MQVWVDGWDQSSGRVAPAVRERVLQMLRDNYASVALEPTARPLQPPAAGRLGEVRVPTLIVVGSLDTPDTLRGADLMSAGIAGARKVVFEGAAHLPSMEQPERFNQLVLEVLNGVPG